MLVLATVCRRFGSWGLLTKLNFCSDFEQFGQDFEVEVQARFCDRRNSSPGIIYSRHFFQLHPSSWSEIFHKLQKVCSVENLSRALHFVNFLRFVLTSCSCMLVEKLTQCPTVCTLTTWLTYAWRGRFILAPTYNFTRFLFGAPSVISSNEVLFLRTTFGRSNHAACLRTKA